MGEWGEGKRGVWAKAIGGSQESPQSGQPDVAPSFPPDGWVCCSGTSCQARPLPRQNSGASVNATPRLENGALQESDGESRRPRAGAVRGGAPEPMGHRKRVRLPETRATGGQQRWGGGQPWGQAGGDRLGVGIQFGIAVVGGCCWPEEERQKEGRRGLGPRPFNNTSHLPSVARCLFPVRRPKTFPSLPGPLRLR